MNDFTKEELCLIEKYIDSHECDLNTFDTEVRPLLDKVSSLIENYCEHEWQNRCCGVYDAAVLCGKCGVDL